MASNISDSKPVFKNGKKIVKLRPFCYINNIYHQLEYRDCLRFSHGDWHLSDDDIDFNTLWIKYQEGLIKLESVLDAYIKSGCSYELVYSYFSKGGGNNEIIMK